MFGFSYGWATQQSLERSRIQTVKYLNLKIGSVRISYAYFAALGYSITYYKKLKK